MSKSPVHHAVARQWELLKNLPSRGPGITAAALTEKLDEAGYSVTKRSIERDLNELSGLFGIRCNDVSKPYGWFWLQDHSIDLPGMDIADALSLALVEKQLSELTPVAFLRVLAPKFKQARKKLGASTNNRFAQWTNQVRYVSPTLPFLPPKIDPRVLELVQDSIIQKRQLQVQYLVISEASPKELRLHPLAFIQNGPISYLVATAFDYTDPRVYALHRIHSAQMTGEPARSPAGFSLDKFLVEGGMQFGDNGMICLKAMITNQLACYLAESPLTDDQRLTPKRHDQYLLTATIKDSWQLQFWILSQGAEITITHPKNLRKRIRENLQAALAGYRTG